MDSPCAITVAFDRYSVGITMNKRKVLSFESEWAASIGHQWEDVCIPREPFFAAAFLGTDQDQVNFVPLVTEVRSGRAVSLS